MTMLHHGLDLLELVKNHLYFCENKIQKISLSLPTGMKQCSAGLKASSACSSCRGSVFREQASTGLTAVSATRELGAERTEPWW